MSNQNRPDVDSRMIDSAKGVLQWAEHMLAKQPNAWSEITIGQHHGAQYEVRGERVTIEIYNEYVLVLMDGREAQQGWRTKYNAKFRAGSELLSNFVRSLPEKKRMHLERLEARDAEQLVAGLPTVPTS